VGRGRVSAEPATPTRHTNLFIGGCGYVGHLLATAIYQKGGPIEGGMADNLHCGGFVTFDLRECHACPWHGRNGLKGSPGIVGDATDFGRLWFATKGIDGIVYGAEGDVDDPASLFSAAVHGVYNALSVARARNMRRFVLLSSISVHSPDNGGGLAYAPDLGEDAPPQCDHPDGVSVLNSEWMCRYFAETFGMSVIALRLCGPCSDALAQERHRKDESWSALAATDLVMAIGRAIALEGHTGFEVINIAGDFTGEMVDISKAKRLLGWEPTI
jgi:nucleoside-diphosphate-sugar epimerase